jgi:hypothetical protein
MQTLYKLSNVVLCTSDRLSTVKLVKLTLN